MVSKMSKAEIMTPVYGFYCGTIQVTGIFPDELSSMEFAVLEMWLAGENA
jgi:hypothetical protein